MPWPAHPYLPLFRSKIKEVLLQLPGDSNQKGKHLIQVKFFVFSSSVENHFTETINQENDN